MYRNPVFHQAVFATIIISSGLRVTYLIKWSPEYSAKTPSSITTPILSMFWTGGALFLLGFGIWNLDNIFCGTLTGWKRVFGWPAAFFLEGECDHKHNR
jgi:dihydroceramidase